MIRRFAKHTAQRHMSASLFAKLRCIANQSGEKLTVPCDELSSPNPVIISSAANITFRALRPETGKAMPA